MIVSAVGLRAVISEYHRVIATNVVRRTRPPRFCDTIETFIARFYFLDRFNCLIVIVDSLVQLLFGHGRAIHGYSVKMNDFDRGHGYDYPSNSSLSRRCAADNE